ncbi:MAG: VWA domain-containing protein [Phycisphaeraceae bacterium]|nr:VWA domain-containing protein [Phycisphaeraceae bacterium]
MSPRRIVSWLSGVVVGAASLGAGAQVQVESFAPNIVVPQSRVIVAPDWQNPIRVASVNSTIDINEQVASTTLRMTLTNPSSRQQEAEVLLPVPEGAAIRYFKLDGLGGDGGARLLPRDEARRIYESIVRRMKDPAILEFAGCGFIRSNVFPVPAQGTQVITLTYEQLLPAVAGRIDYTLPRTQSLEDTGIDWAIEVTARSERGIASVFSPSHTLLIEQQPGDHEQKRVRLQVANAGDPGSLMLSLVLRDSGSGMAGTFMAYPDPNVATGGRGGYVMFLASVPPVENRPTIRREVTLVIDRSGSMRGEKIEQARAAALQVIEALNDGEFFNIFDYSDVVDSFSAAPVAKDTQSVARAREYIANIKAIGGTNIHDALVEALRQPPTQGTLPMVLFLTDGLPTIGQTRESVIRDAARHANTHERRIFSFGVGFDVNAPLLTAIARDTRASGTFVQPKEDVEVKVGQVFRRLSGPVLAKPVLSLRAENPAVLGIAPLKEVLPRELPDVYEGDQLLIVAQHVSDEPVVFQVRGNYLGRERTFEFRFDPSVATTRHAFVSRVWAMRKIGSLLEQIRLGSADLPASVDPSSDPRFKELVDEIVRLSMDFGVMTEYTAFLADEDSGVFARDQIQLGATINVIDNAIRERAGGGAVAQELNREAGNWPQDSAAEATLRRRLASARENGESLHLAPAAAPAKQAYYGFAAGDELVVNQVLTLQQVDNRAIYKKGSRWVEGQLLTQSAEAEETIEFGSDRYFEVAAELARQNRQAMLANRGDLYLMYEGKRVLVRNPS